MQKTDELVNTLVKAVDEIQSKKAKGYDTQATVTRIEGSTAYVHIPGGVDETPAQLTINANKGDTVRVRVAGGTAWLVGNATNPPTDDATANAAAITANTANAMAGAAIESANIAQEAAEDAQQSAREAKTSANEAKQSAKVADQQARYATNSANNALIQLDTVESVVDTLNWITTHSTFVLTSDASVVSGKTYYLPHENFITTYQSSGNVNGVIFTVNADKSVTVDGTANADIHWSYSANATGHAGEDVILTGCPEGGSDDTYWLQIQSTVKDYGNGAQYTQSSTADPSNACRIEIKSGTRVDNLTFKPMVRRAIDGYEDFIIGASADDYYIVPNPSGDPSAQGFYELDIDDAVKTYVQAHLALTNQGLFVLMDNSGYKVKINNYGMYVQAPNGQTVNQSTADGNTIMSENGDVIAHLGYDEGASESGTAYAPYYTLGTRVLNSTIGNYSLAQGVDVIASAIRSHAEGNYTTASNWDSHAEGHRTTASGYWSHAEGGGGDPGATGSTASGLASHAEGETTTASSTGAHSEGIGTTASALAAHAEGNETQATEQYASAAGNGTIAQRASQLVIGTFNEADTGTVAPITKKGDYAFIIGNGSADNSRSNAMTVDWSGNTKVAGKVTLGAAPVANMDAATKKYVNDTVDDYLPLAGGTMTGQIKTSFKDSVAPGTYHAAANTIPNLVTEVRYSSGCAGSFNLTSAYTKDNITIGASSGGTWYNFAYIPHRSGGVNGTAPAGNDNVNYGTLMIWGMTADVGGMYMIRVASGSIQKLYAAGWFTDSTTSTGVGTMTWTVHKYADGTCEAYGTTPAVSCAVTTQWQNAWYASKTQNLPSSLFKTVTYASVERSVLNSGSGGELITTSVNGMASSNGYYTSITWYVINSKSGVTGSYAFSIMVKGTWK